MSQILFGNDSSGPQFGVNNGVINVLSDRTETPQQRVDNEILRSLAFSQMLDRRENVEPCHTNTCEWILDLEKYQSWRSESRGLLWIKGKPGAGKSTLMVFLHGKLKSLQDGNQGIQLDFFFTARGTEMQRTPLGMLRSLLNQIFDRDASVRPQVRETYEQRCRQFGYSEGNWEWTQGVLEELLAGVILASASRQHVTVFVDALDETGAESARQLAAYFHRLITRAAKGNAAVRVCISCRHYPIIGSSQTMEIYVEHHNQKDIATYIKDVLAETEVEDNPSEEKRQILMEQLIQQANGVFQWARLVMPLVRQRIDEGESFDDICSWLREVPVGLEDVYMYILNEVIEVWNLEQSFLLFQWVCLAERPLTVVEMRYAMVGNNAQIMSAPKTWEKICGFVESDERMKRRIKALSGGLAEVVWSGVSNDTVQVVHQSVNDFLRAKGLAALSDKIEARSSVLQRGNILLQCQANLYRSCLAYMAFLRVYRDMSIDSQATSEELIRNHPLVAYATTNLFIHAEKAANSRVMMLRNDHDILQQVISQWVQIYRIIDPWSPMCPRRETTVIHMAAAANLVDIIELASLNSEEVARKDEDGNIPFHLAARHGHITAGRILREKAADCGATNRNGRTPLIEAAGFGHTEFVEWLLLEGVKLEVTMSEGASALQEASLGGHRDVVDRLLGAGAEVNAKGGFYGNALQAAAYAGSSEIVRILLDAGADINTQGGLYGNAVQAAAYGRSSEIVRILLDAGADINTQGGLYGNAVQAAAYGRSSEIVRILLDAGADINTQGGEYGNALQATAYAGSSEIVRILLDAGADINAQGGEYSNALQATAYAGSSEIVRILLDAGADINAQGGEYGNALQAATYGESSEIVRILLDAGADIHAQGGLYGNALQAAAYGESSEIVRILLDAGADINAQGGEYGNALQAAAYAGSSEIVRILLDAGADIHAQGGEYGNALQAAVTHGESSEIVRILLDAGADINAQGGEYGNALQAAAYGRSSEIVRILLDAGADIHAQGGQYGNAVQAAAYGRSSEIVRILLDAGADINTQGGLYGNAVQAATYAGSSEIVRILLDAGADIHAQGGQYGNALQAATYGENSEIVRILLDAGADIHAQGGQYGNALQATAYAGSSEIVRILLDAGADVHAQGGQYGNALQATAYAGSSEIVRILLDAGADVHAQGGQYGNALQAAVTYGESSEIVRILLDAGADVNAQGGRYGSSLLAAVYHGHADQVQMLLHAGGNVLLADELGQTPLHIAASKNRLNLLHSFPELLSPINTRDKLLQTPVHLAICLGHIEFATSLLHLGANPSLSDGYGRNILDWALGNESLVHQIQKHYPSIVTTPDNTQELAVRQSILQISDTFLQSQLHFPWPLLQQFGRYLLFVSDEDNAQCLFQLHLSQETLIGNPVYKTTCDICTQVINGSRFVCRICAHVDLCSSCVQKYPFHSRLHPNQEHKTFEVSYMFDRESPLTTSVSEKLRELVDKLSAPNTQTSGNGPSHDSVAYLPSKVTAPKSTAAFSMALLGPISTISMFCLLSFGLITVSFTYWYTLI